MKGIDIVGPLPPGAQRVTFFAAGIPVTARNPVGAKKLIQWLASPAAYAAIHKSGLEPAKSKQSNRRVPQVRSRSRVEFFNGFVAILMPRMRYARPLTSKTSIPEALVR